MTGAWTCLIRIKSKDGSRSHLIDKLSFTLGRTQDADLPLVDPSVSRLHARIVCKDEFVWITDESSANGTFINGKRIKPGESVVVEPDDALSFGTVPAEFKFLVIPKPYELLDQVSKTGEIAKSMEGIAAQIEMRAKVQAEQEVKRAKQEVEQMLAAARRDTEIVRTQELLEIQQRKQTLEAELSSMRRNSQETLGDERSRARRDADVQISEAQKKIQKDYEEANFRIQEQIKINQEHCLRALEEAESKAAGFLRDAREESAKIRISASEEARQIQLNANKKSSEIIALAQEQMQKEVTSKKDQLLGRAAQEALRERERLNQDFAAHKELLAVQANSLETKVDSAKAELDKIASRHEQLQSDCERIEKESADAKELLNNVEKLEERKKNAEAELKEFIANRAEGMAKIEVEAKEMRTRLVAEYEMAKAKQVEDLTQAKIKAAQEVQTLVRSEEKKYEESKRLRSMDLTERLYEDFIPHISDWANNPTEAVSGLKSSIKRTVDTVIIGEESTVHVSAVTQAKSEKKLKNKTWVRRVSFVAGFVLVVSGAWYAPGFMHYLENKPHNEEASQMIEQRKIQSIYNPEQKPEFRETYTDNVLYMKNYLDVKTDPNVIEKWTLRLNNIEILRPMGLSEEDIVQFVAKETNLIQRLKALRGSIDAVYLTEGLNHMRAAETEDVTEIKKVLKGEEHLKTIRKMEKEFINDQIKKMNP